MNFKFYFMILTVAATSTATIALADWTSGEKKLFASNVYCVYAPTKTPTYDQLLDFPAAKLNRYEQYIDIFVDADAETHLWLMLDAENTGHIFFWDDARNPNGNSGDLNKPLQVIARKDILNHPAARLANGSKYFAACALRN